MKLLDAMFRSGGISELFSDEAVVRRMLEFEAALARAEARCGILPDASARVIAEKCKPEGIDFPALTNAAANAGNLAIPLVKQLTALVAKENPSAAGFVHCGATSQDVIDTGTVLALREGFAIAERDLRTLANELAGLVARHRHTVMAGRTWMQQALPTTFGFKAAGWLDAVTRQRQRMAETKRRALVLQLGGAVGTLAALGEKGFAVAETLANELKLPLPAAPWHSHRDRMGEVATTFGLLTGTMGKIARDIALHAQTEIGEITEPASAGRGGSSTMPQKQNPVACAAALAAAARVPGLVSTMLVAMPQEDERGLGGWQAEWETLPEIVTLSCGALHGMAAIAGKLEIHEDRMKENLELTRGLIFAEGVSIALARKMGKAKAHEAVEGASRKAQSGKRHLRDVLAEEASISRELSGEEWKRLFEPAEYLGATTEFIERVLATHATMDAALEGNER